jgi:hypothetical protein
MRKVLFTLLLLCSLAGHSQSKSDSLITDTTRLFSIRDLQRIQALLFKMPYELAQPVLVTMQQLLDERLREFDRPKKQPKK